MSFELRLLLAALASYRMAGMIVWDEGPWSVFLAIRAFFGVYDLGANGHPMTRMGRLLACPFCTGVYTSLLCTIPVLFPGTFGDLFLILFGVIGAQALLESIGPR